MGKKCKWARAFDQNFNIGCVNKTKQRGNGNFKSCNGMSSKWEFVFCPYCGNEIEVIYLNPPEKIIPVATCARASEEFCGYSIQCACNEHCSGFVGQR